MGARPFLTARWADLCLFNYEVPEGLIASRLPRGFTLDRWEGRAFVSVVAFRFLETRVMGVRWPGLVDFPEVNLRFYAVAPDGRRGVVFVREYVPQRLIGWVARAVYNEPYAAAPMTMGVSERDGVRSLAYTIGKVGALGTIRAEVDSAATTPALESAEHHFKEHRWGFGRAHSGRPLVYEVRHPVWRTYAVRAARCEIDWPRLYGEAWGVMRGVEPDSVVVAEGSGVEVFGGVAMPG